MFLGCSVFRVHAESLQQPGFRSTPLPPGHWLCIQLLHGTAAWAECSWWWTPRTAVLDSNSQHDFSPTWKSYKKNSFPLRNSLAQPNADTPELVTGKVSINDCPVLQISCHDSLPWWRCSSSLGTEGLTSCGLGLRLFGSSSWSSQSTPCTSTLLGERTSFLQPGWTVSMMQRWQRT